MNFDLHHIQNFEKDLYKSPSIKEKDKAVHKFGQFNECVELRADDEQQNTTLLQLRRDQLCVSAHNDTTQDSPTVRLIFKTYNHLITLNILIRV